MKFTEKGREKRVPDVTHYSVITPMRGKIRYQIYLSAALNVLLRFTVFSSLTKANQK